MNVLKVLAVVFLVQVGCSRILINSIKKTNAGASFPKVSRGFSSASNSAGRFPKLKRFAKLSALGAAGLITVAVNTPTLDHYVIEQVSKKAEPDLPDSNGRTPIFNAVLESDKKAFFSQIEARANLNARDNFGVTLLEAAIMNDLSMYYTVLMLSGIDMKQMDGKGRPYLYTAISNHKFFLARQIIRDVKINYSSELLKELLRLACMALSKEGVELKERAAQIPLIIDLYLMSNCDREALIQILQDSQANQIDPNVKIAIKMLINSFALNFLCPVITTSDNIKEIFYIQTLNLMQ